jgi:hypothetical protein
MEWKIDARATGAPLPEEVAGFQEHRAELVSPHAGVLSSEERFDVRIPGATAAFVQNGSHQIPLLRGEGDHFVVETSLTAGVAEVFAQFPESSDEGYQGLLRYQVR